MYLAVSVGDAVARFLNEANPLGDPLPGITYAFAFETLAAKIAHRLEERLRGVGWNTTAVTRPDSGSLAAMSIRSLRSPGQELQSGKDDTVVHLQACFALLVALTDLLEEVERRQAKGTSGCVRIRRFLSSPGGIVDPHAPLQIGEQLWRY